MSYTNNTVPVTVYFEGSPGNKNYPPSAPNVVYVQNVPPPNVQYQQTTTTNPVYVNQRGIKRFRPLAAVMLYATFFYITSGMNLALGLGWNMGNYIETTKHFQFCWFIGVIAGALLAAPFFKILPIRFFMLASATLAVVAGIIFTSAEANYDAIIAARYINGIATGLSMVAFLSYVGEVAPAMKRGFYAANVQYGISFGIIFQIALASEWRPDLGFGENQVHGILCIIFGLFAFLKAFLFVESPIFYLRRHNYEAALDSLQRLQMTFSEVVTNETFQKLEKQKEYLRENESKSMGACLGESGSALLRLLLFRGLNALTFTLPLSRIILFASAISIGYAYNWVPIVYAVLRFVGILIALFLVDGLGRKLPSLFALICITGFTIGVGIIYSVDINFGIPDKMSIVCSLAMLVQFFAGFYTPSTDAYMTEAFALNLKPYCIALCIIVEQLVQIIIICTFEFYVIHNIFVFSITSGVIMFVLFVLFSITMPETRKISLGAAQTRFQKFIYLKCY